MQLFSHYARERFALAGSGVQFPVGPRVVAVTADGKRFLAAMPVNQSGPPQFTVVQNWQALLKK